MVLLRKIHSHPIAVRASLVEKGLSYDLKTLDPESLPNGFDLMNPNLRAFLLIDQDKIIFKSDNLVDTYNGYFLIVGPGLRGYYLSGFKSGFRNVCSCERTSLPISESDEGRRHIRPVRLR